MTYKYFFFFLLSVNLYGFDHTHSTFQKVLNNYVKKKDQQTYVDYKSLKKNSNDLDQYIKTIESLDHIKYLSWSENQKLAFLINAYNALTLKLIIDHYPLESIRDIGNFFTPNAWKKKFFHLFGKKHHLDYIEHEVIRKDFKRPRIHFAVVCASMSCPNLKKKVYVHKKLNKQLEDSAQSFLKNPHKNRIDVKNKTLYLSKIFKWYGDDFTDKDQTFLNLVATHLATNDQQKNEIQDSQYKIQWLDYSWKLNEL